ncbi:TPA: flagellar protein FliT [Enterobacter cancerogenus]|jgi:hypothetical protein|uniref:Flagellar protein FliT n=1 Tax=Enterobacter cancerogenus TaxID=69218 RepID=A0A484XS67_9ENTR|nr:flagellar protein FliT [Enterobacter cancerogenus]EFC55214.1 hypothetical protein ENTCAN_07929 [Enterobacter cancerogenus ATCC 35316]KTQ45115.1 hypothetical protein NS104_22555 [Enterobacter cancerogenus]KTQ47491.1 hypothetical protein NS111_21520 [Enterobacter cancerogenus]KTQ70848.1 hypothetical protein NS188_17445 [Enterobacter cancerogenus]KTQ81450.1 hypothetical protein NS31R_10590 [Enterobacter cancerogenus]
MDDVQVMRYLARSLTHAASQHDWPAMQDVDAQIAALLASLKGQTLSAEKREALADLQQTHANVSRFCQAQSDDLEQKMASARRNREGATAYALFADAEDRGQ